MANGIQGENYSMGFQPPRMFRHMRVQINNIALCMNYLRRVFIKASLFCDDLCHSEFGILTWQVDIKQHGFIDNNGHSL